MFLLSSMSNINGAFCAAFYPSVKAQKLHHQLEGSEAYVFTPQEENFTFTLSFTNPDLKDGTLGTVKKGHDGDDGLKLIPAETMPATRLETKLSVIQVKYFL